MKLKTTIAPIFKGLALLLILSVLLPSAVKLSHVFNHHKHEVCQNDGDINNTHFHELDLDCEFYKFKLSQNHYFLDYNYEESPELSSTIQTISYYRSLYKLQLTTRFLRGPPTLHT